MAELSHVLTTYTEDGTLKLVLAEVQGDLPSRWRCFMPNDVLLPDRLLGSEAAGTLFAEAARTRKPQVIADIEANLSKKGLSRKAYVALDVEEEDRGSIVCYPLYSPHLRRSPYVLSIKSDVPSLISKSFVKKYREPIKIFCNQLLLEAHLEVIRHPAGGSNDN